MPIKTVCAINPSERRNFDEAEVIDRLMEALPTGIIKEVIEISDHLSRCASLFRIPIGTAKSFFFSQLYSSTKGGTLRC